MPPRRDRELRYNLTANSRGLRRGIGQAERELHGLERTTGRTARRVIGNFARIAGTAGIGAVGLGLANAVRQGIGFEKEMSRVRAVTNATGAEMRRLTAFANKMGAETKFSSAEAASAMYELGAAGFRVRDMGAALRGTLALAAASNIDLASASEITANALRGFGLRTGEAGRVADVLARTVNASSVEMNDLRDSMKYIGPIARATGQDFDQMVAAVGIMGDAGIKGEQAGTTLRTALVRLTRPTKIAREGLREFGLTAQDLQGPNGLKPLGEIIALIERRSEGMDKATRNAALAQIFGTEALSGMTAILSEGSDELERHTQANERSRGTAERTAKTMQDNVAGAWEQLTGSIETAGIALYSNFRGPMKDVLDDVTGWVNEASEDLNDFFETLARDPEFQAGDIGKKFEIIVRELERRGVPEKIANAIADGVVGGLELAIKTTAVVAPRMAAAFVEAFLEAPVWARALGTAWLLRKLGGRRRAAAAGAAMGSSFAGGFAGTAGPAGVAAGIVGGRGAAGRRGPGAAVVAQRQRGPGWQQWRPGAPVSQLGPRQRGLGRLQGAIGRGLGRARGAAGGALAALGGPAGIAIGTLIIAGPEIVRSFQGGRSGRFGLPQRSGFERFVGSAPLGVGGLGRAFGVGRPSRLQRFGERAEQRLRVAVERRDIRALQQLDREAQNLAKHFPEAKKALNTFARAAQDNLRKINAHRRFTREVRQLEGLLGSFSRSPWVSLKNLRYRINANAEQIARDIGTHTQEGRNLMGKNIGAGIRVIQRGMRTGEISTREGMKEIRRLIKRDTGASAEITSTNFHAVADVIRQQIRRGEIAVDKGLKEIRRLMVASMRSLGINEGDIARRIQQEGRGVLAGHGSGRRGQFSPNRRAQGGFLGRQGEKGRDTVPVWAGRGEYVATGHQQAPIELGLAISRELGLQPYGSLDELSALNRPHFMARGGFVQGAMSRGLTGPTLSFAHRMFARGFSVTDAFRPGGRTNHGRGTALDFGDSVNNMARLAAILIPMRRQFAELYGPRGSWRFGKRVPQVPNHLDHWHVALAGRVGALGGGAPRIRRVRVRGDLGVISTIAQASVDRVRRAAQDRLDELAMEAPIGAHGAGQAAGRGATANMRLGRRMMLAAGWGPEQWPHLKALWTRESGWNNRVRNPSSGAFGIPQALPPGKMGSAAVSGNAAAQIRWGLNYIRQRYGSPARANAFQRANNWYQSGGRVGALSRALRVSPARARQLLRRTLKPADLRRLNITETRARELGLRLDPVSFRYLTYSTFMRRAGEGAEVLERAGDRVGYLERLHGLTDEDLMLPSGREERLAELGAITTAQQEITKTRRVQFQRLNNASVAARKALNAARATDRRLLKEIKAAKEGSKERKRLVRQRDQVRSRIKRLEGHRREALTAREEAQRALRDARLDVEETQRAIAEVNAPAAIAQSQLELIELQEAAGQLNAQQAFQLRHAARLTALRSGKLSQRDWLSMYAAQREDIAAQRVDPLQSVSDRLAEIDLRLRAGEFGEDTAAERAAQAEREQALRETLGRGDLTRVERLELTAQLREVTKAIDADRQAREEHTQALKDVRDQQKEILNLANRAQSVEVSVLRRAIADIASGELASSYGHRARAAGNGSVAR